MRYTKIWLALACAAAAVAGCARIPHQTPELLGLCAERLEGASAVDGQVMQTLITNADLSAREMGEIAAALRAINSASLSAAEQKALADAVAQLDASAADLRPSDKVRARPARSAAITADVCSDMRQVQTMLSERVDQDRLVGGLVDRARGKKEGENK